VPSDNLDMDFELPLLDTAGLEREESTAFAAGLAEDHWLARTDVGVAVLRYRDALGSWRDPPLPHALSLLRVEGRSGQLPGDAAALVLSTRARSTRACAPGLPAFTRRRPTAPPAIFAPGGPSLLEPTSRRPLRVLSPTCQPYPIPIICEVLGAPPEDWRQFSNWAGDIFQDLQRQPGRDAPAIEQASKELSAYIAEMVDERRRSPREDLPRT